MKKTLPRPRPFWWNSRKNATSLHQWLQARKATLLSQHEEIKAQKQQREELFAGPDVAAARAQPEAATERAEQQLTLADQQLQKHETALANAESQLRQREQDAAHQAQTRDTRYAALVADLRTAGLPPPPPPWPSACSPMTWPSASRSSSRSTTKPWPPPSTPSLK
ncbi:hypothetical protein ACFQT0_19860 [Hymenobacter humi]|uniref:Uncharacterized protein n=1 Tax=Hymenobacter humi TaxID=1411620 RepID=A0ABW2U780_9BACT